MAIQLTPLNSFTFTPEAGDPTYLNRGLQGDDIAYDPLTKTIFVAYTDDPDGQNGTAFTPKRAVLQFGSNNPGSPDVFGTYLSGFDAAPALLANAVGITPITSGLGSGNFLVVSSTTGGANTTEIVEYKADGTIATDGLLGVTGRLTLPPPYYTNLGSPVGLAITGIGTLLVAMSQSQDLVEFSLTAKNADGTAQVLSTFDLTPFGLTRLAGLAIDPISGNFIVTDDFGGGTGLIYEFTPHRQDLLTATLTATVAGTPTPFPYPQEVNFPRLGNLVTIINPKQAFNFQDPEGVSFDPATRQLYVVFDGDDDVITDGSNNKVSVFSVATLDPNPPNPTDLNATPVPVLTNFSKFGQENGTIAFASTDFTDRFSNSKADPLTLAAIDIVTLPKHGTLTLGGVNVTRGQVITSSQLSTLVYTPTASYSGTDTFLVQAAETVDPAGKPVLTAPGITNVDLFVSDTTAIQVSQATNTYRFFSADDIVFNPSTGTIFAAESYRVNPLSAASTVWILKEINAETGAEIRTIVQSATPPTASLGGRTYTPLPEVPIVDLIPGQETREGIQGIGVVAGTGPDRDGNILLLSTRGREVFEIDPDDPVGPVNATTGISPLKIPTNGIQLTATDFFNPNNPGIVSDSLHLPGGAFTVSPGGLGSAVGVFHAVVEGQEVLYIADYSTRELLQYSKTGIQTGVVVDLQQITNGRIQGVTYDAVTGNFLLVDEETIAIYEVTPTGQLVGITDILSKATGDAALVNKFRDVEGATIDPQTRTLYLGFDDDQPGPAGAFGEDTIGNLIASFDLSGGTSPPNQLTLLFDPPVFEEDSYELTVDVTVEDGDEVGEPITASDPDDGDTVAYSITAGNEDLDEDQKAAFAIDTSTGQITVNDADDLALLDVFNLTVTGTDSTGLTDTTDVEITVDKPGETDTDGIFSCSDLFKLIVSSITLNVNVNVGIFFVDGADGNIGGLLPGADGYAAAALGRALSLLGLVAQANDTDNKGFNFPPGQLKKVLGLQSAAALTKKSFASSSEFFFGFLSAETVSIGDLFAIVNDLNRSGDLTDLLDSISLSTDDGAAIEDDGEGLFTITLGEFSFSVTFDQAAVDDSFGGLLGIDLNGDDDNEEIVDEVIAQCENTGEYTISGSIFREAAYNNTIGFFLVNADGDVLDSRGNVVATPDDLTNYKAAIVANLITENSSAVEYQVSDNSTINFSFSVTTVTASVYVLPVLAVQGDFTKFSDIYYPIIAANKDKTDHMKFQGAKATGNGRFFGFEDLQSNISDNDFDDFIIQVNVSAATA